ncbi:MAG: YybH family protein [Phycisphaerales bacterium]|jgi:hypothetical protein
MTLANLVALFAIALLIMGCAATNTASNSSADGRTPGARTPQEATDEFYSALQAMFRGDAQPMKNAWWHDDEAVYMGPGGDYRIGWGDIAKEWDRQASKNLGGKVDPTRLHFVEGGDFALLTCMETGTNEVDGRTTTVSLRTSTVFLKRDGVWKAISHQSDTLPYLETSD